MDAGFRIDPSDPRPIWRQIEENVRHLVASGILPPATAVPSVRDLARSLTVNPATVAKAYQRLADAGVLAVRRGDGTYVAAAPPIFSTEERGRRLAVEARRYADAAVTLGATPPESVAALETAWTALGAAAGAAFSAKPAAAAEVAPAPPLPDRSDLGEP